MKRSFVSIFNIQLIRNLFVLATFLSLFACSKRDSSSSAAKSGDASSKEQTLIFATAGDAVGLDLARHDEGESLNVGVNILENLVEMKMGTTQIEPRLASHYTISKDGLTYTFKIRPNVFFTDGTPLNADAVIFNFERQSQKDHPGYASGAPFKYWENMAMSGILKEIRKVDDMTVSFILKQPNAPFLANLTMPFLAIASPTAILKYGQAFDQNPVGTGAYLLKSWRKDNQLELVANPNYWGEKAKIPRVIVRVIPDPQVRRLELEKGNVHIMVFPNPSEVASLKANPNLKVLQAEGLNIGYMAFNMKKKPLEKLEVRQAISMAVDRKRILSEVFQGNAALAKNPMPSMLLGYADSVKDLEYNPERAKTLLEKAGLSGIQLELWAPPVPRAYNPNPKKTAEFMQADLKRIGIDTKIVSYDWGTYLDKIGKGEHELALVGWNGDNGDPDNFLMTLWSKEAALASPANNYSFYINEEMTGWLKQAQIETINRKRAELYKKVQVQMDKDRVILPIAHAVDVVAMRKEVKGYKLHFDGARRFAGVTLGSELQEAEGTVPRGREVVETHDSASD